MLVGALIVGHSVHVVGLLQALTIEQVDVAVQFGELMQVLLEDVHVERDARLGVHRDVQAQPRVTVRLDLRRLPFVLDHRHVDAVERAPQLLNASGLFHLAACAKELDDGHLGQDDQILIASERLQVDALVFLVFFRVRRIGYAQLFGDVVEELCLQGLEFALLGVGARLVHLAQLGEQQIEQDLGYAQVAVEQVGHEVVQRNELKDGLVDLATRRIECARFPLAAVVCVCVCVVCVVVHDVSERACASLLVHYGPLSVQASEILLRTATPRTRMR